MSIYGTPLERLSATSPATPEGETLQQAVLAVLENNNLTLIMDPAIQEASAKIMERSQLMQSQRGLDLIADVNAMWAEAKLKKLKWVNTEACIALVKLDAGDTLDQAMPEAQSEGGWSRL